MSNSGSSADVLHHSNNSHGHTSAAPEVIVDALPYYDGGYDEPGAREAVNQSFFFFKHLFNLF